MPLRRLDSDRTGDAARPIVARSAAADGGEADGLVSPYVYESLDPSDASPDVVRGKSRSARLVGPHVDVVQQDGVVSEIVVSCPCGCRTRIQLEYGEGT